MSRTGKKENLTAHFGTETLSTCLTSQLLTVNPQLAQPSPRCRTRKPAYASCCFVARVCLCGLAMVVAKYTKQAWMTTVQSNLIVKGCQECIQCTTKLRELLQIEADVSSSDPHSRKSAVSLKWRKKCYCNVRKAGSVAERSSTGSWITSLYLHFAYFFPTLLHSPGDTFLVQTTTFSQT